MGNAVLEATIVGQNHQTFRILVQPASSVIAGLTQIVRQRGTFTSELAKYAERLVEQDQVVGIRPNRVRPDCGRCPCPDGCPVRPSLAIEC